MYTIIAPVRARPLESSKEEVLRRLGGAEAVSDAFLRKRPLEFQLVDRQLAHPLVCDPVPPSLPAATAPERARAFPTHSPPLP